MAFLHSIRRCIWARASLEAGEVWNTLLWEGDVWAAVGATRVTFDKRFAFGVLQQLTVKSRHAFHCPR